MNNLPKIIAIIGPTASGKTDLGVFLAQKLNGEIVSADAKQVYKGMDIGTAKETDLPVPQHLTDFKEPGEKITVGEYQQKAYEIIGDILQRGSLPILVGGSGLYAEAVLSGYIFKEGEKSRAQKPLYQSIKIGLKWDREELKERVKKRTKLWLEQGILEEIANLLDKGVSPDWLKSHGMEYRYFTSYLLGEINLEEAIEKTNFEINQFIKRQYTWWRRHPDVHWVENREAALILAKKFLA